MSSEEKYRRLMKLRALAEHLPLVVGIEGSGFAVYWDSDDGLVDPIFTGPETHARVYLAGFSRGFINAPVEAAK